MTGPLVEIRQLSHSFGTHKALDEIALNVEPGSYTVLLGPSGSGKTTLLSILGGFLAPQEGRVFIRGEDCTATPPARRPTATVFQDYALFPHLSVGDNVGFGLRMRGVGRSRRNAKVRETLAMVGLADAYSKEPLGALDLKLRRQMQDELKALQKRVGTAFIHVTHDQEEAMALADHCVVMNQGRIEDQGPPERVYSRPASRFTATFMGESTLLTGKVQDLGMDEISVATEVGPVAISASGEPGFDVTLAIRPEHITLVDVPPSVTLGEAKVTDVVFQGSFKRLLAVSDKNPEVTFIVKVPSNRPVSVGDTVELFCPAADMILMSR